LRARHGVGRDTVLQQVVEIRHTIQNLQHASNSRWRYSATTILTGDRVNKPRGQAWWTLWSIGKYLMFREVLLVKT